MTRLNEVGSGNSFSRMRKFTRNKSSVLKNYKRATYQKKRKKNDKQSKTSKDPRGIFVPKDSRIKLV